MSIPIAVFDVVANCFWGAQFLLPIYKIIRRLRDSGTTQMIQSERKLKDLAFRTAWATFGTCAASTANVTAQILLNLKEEAWILQLQCSFEVVCSCIIVRQSRKPHLIVTNMASCIFRYNTRLTETLTSHIWKKTINPIDPLNYSPHRIYDHYAYDFQERIF